jgi:hypothetical protein
MHPIAAFVADIYRLLAALGITLRRSSHPAHVQIIIGADECVIVMPGIERRVFISYVTLTCVSARLNFMLSGRRQVERAIKFRFYPASFQI